MNLQAVVGLRATGIATRKLRARIERLANAYAGVLFCTSPRLGAWLAAITLCSPRAAFAGVIGLLAAAAWSKLFALNASSDAHLVNSLLCGLFMGAPHALDGQMIAWVIAAALMVTLLSHWLAGLLWRAGQLPVLSLPFTLTCWLIALATQSSPSSEMLAAPLNGAAGVSFGASGDEFFTALGWLLLVPYPLAGALVFAGLVAASRYLAILALAGYLGGQLALMLFARNEAITVGYNFMLAAMALGGIFAVPGRRSFLMALAGGACTGWIVVAFTTLLHGVHLPLLTLPFVVSVYLWLGAMSVRQSLGAPILLLDAPSAPEISFERWRLANGRGIGTEALASVPVTAPFFGEWKVTQGFDGPYTHQAAWRHALDFEIFEGPHKGSGSGAAKEDYFCFGASVTAPIAGHVVAAVDELPDMKPGQQDLTNNWGNHLLLRSATGAHVLLAHLKQGSVLATAGTWVTAGQVVAACGSSGRSPTPHLHLQAQASPVLGGATMPFHLTNVLVRAADGVREFHLCYQARQDDIVCAAVPDAALTQALSLPATHVREYRIRNQADKASVRTQTTLFGQQRIASDNGASFGYDVSGASLNHFDRQGPRHPLLDAWMLALGITPLSTAADVWHDRPSVHLLPLNLWQRLAVACLLPLGGALHSTYRRTWDSAEASWRQDGEHRFPFPLVPGIVWTARTRAWIAPDVGVRRLDLHWAGRHWSAELEHAGPAATSF